MSTNKFTPQSLHKVHTHFGPSQDVSGSTAVNATPIVFSLDRPLDIHNIGAIATTAATGGSSAATIEIGTIADPNAYGTITVPAEQLVEIYIPGVVATQTIPAGTPVFVKHTQDADNDYIGVVVLECGMSDQ